MIGVWLEVVGGVGLAIAAQPIHEAGHAVAARLLTGVWPSIGFWAVHPAGHFESISSVLTVLAAGDVAVIVWWAVMLFISRRYPQHKWVLIGPAFITGLALLNWIASAVLAPFGYSHLGASDAAKFVGISGLHPWILAAVLGGIAVVVTIMSIKSIRSGLQL
jgi:hypothetical protein